MMERDVVLQRILVMKVRETVMDLLMEVNMMAMQDVNLVLCVAATIVESLDCTIMRRMIVVRDQHLTHVQQKVEIIQIKSASFHLCMEAKLTQIVPGMTLIENTIRPGVPHRWTVAEIT